MADPPKSTVARDLMLTDLREIAIDASLEEAMDLLASMQLEKQPVKALIVVDRDGSYQGVLTARSLLRSLLVRWVPNAAGTDDERLMEQELLRVARGRLDGRVRDSLDRDIPTAAPNDGLLALIVVGCRKKMDFIPVVEDGNAIGLVPIATVLQQAAALALTPEDEGIQFDGKTFK